MLALLLLACTATPESTDADDPGPPAPEPDPDADSYVPDDFLPEDPALIVFFGDSITDGVGVDDERDSYVSLLQKNRDAKWPEWTDDTLRSRFGNVRVVDVSRGGAITNDVLELQLPQLWEEIEGSPEAEGHLLVMGTIGGNDLVEDVFGGNLDDGPAEILANLDAIVAWFHDADRFPGGASVAITNVYEPTDGTGQVNECFYGANLANVIPTFDRLGADSKAHAEADGWALVDLRGHFKGHGFNYDFTTIGAYDEDDPTLWLADDCIHPNERGHHEVRRLFLAAIDGVPLPLWIPGASE